METLQGKAEAHALIRMKPGQWVVAARGIAPRGYLSFKATGGDLAVARGMGSAYGEPTSDPYIICREKDTAWHVCKLNDDNETYKIIITCFAQYTAERLIKYAIESKI